MGELAAAISDRFGLDIPPTALFDFPTLGSLGTRIHELRSIVRPSRSGQDSVPVHQLPELRGSVQLISDARGDFPGVYRDDSSTSWLACLASAQEAAAPLHLARWDMDRTYSPEVSDTGTVACRFATMFRGQEHLLFDAELFGLSARDAALADPHLRLLLQHAQVGFGGSTHNQGACPATVQAFILLQAEVVDGVAFQSPIPWVAKRAHQASPP